MSRGPIAQKPASAHAKQYVLVAQPQGPVHQLGRFFAEAQTAQVEADPGHQQENTAGLLVLAEHRAAHQRHYSPHAQQAGYGPVFPDLLVHVAGYARSKLRL